MPGIYIWFALSVNNITQMNSTFIANPYITHKTMHHHLLNQLLCQPWVSCCCSDLSLTLISNSRSTGCLHIGHRLVWNLRTFAHSLHMHCNKAPKEQLIYEGLYQKTDISFHKLQKFVYQHVK